MKLIKIGSSPSCDVVISDSYVSALHAEITILDNGEIIIEDKNSSNGTFVGNKQITPNSEVTVRRGDHVKLANVPLPWSRIPMLPSNNQYKQMINIGSSFRNDIIVSNSTVSRYHAVIKIDKNNNIFICDNGSRNGTQVNGERIAANKDVRIRRGDNIMCAGEDVTEQVTALLPKSHLKGVLGVVASLLVVALVGLGGYFALNSGGIGIVDPAEYQSSVVYIHSAYHYEVNVGKFTFRYPVEEDEYEFASATGFFVDKSGRIGTARHVAVPWDEAYSKETRDVLTDAIKRYIHSQIRIPSVQTYQDLAILRQTALGNRLYQECEDVADLNSKITTLLSGAAEIKGEMDFFAVGYSGRQYESLSDFDKCSLIAESGDARKDVALLQLNTKTTPVWIKNVFDLTKVSSTPLKPMKDELYTIGYPHGFQWNYNPNDKELKNSIRKTNCSKTPGRYNFEFQATSQGGASGSPIFLKNGRLVGVLSAVYSSNGDDNGPTIAAHATFLKQLYDENIVPIAK